jgi:hypothetical protein
MPFLFPSFSSNTRDICIPTLFCPRRKQMCGAPRLRPCIYDVYGPLKRPLDQKWPPDKKKECMMGGKTLPVFRKYF